MSAIEEKRMYGDRREETVAYVAAGEGLASVQLSGDQVGRFGLAHRCTARDVAALDIDVADVDGDVTAMDGDVAVATTEDVLVGPGEFEPLGFGPATAVGVTGDTGAAGSSGTASLLAAAPDGTVARYADEGWHTIGTAGDVRAISAGFVAAADGVSRAGPDGLTDVGLSAVRDVAGEAIPLAATDDGLYRLGNGWLAERTGAFATVAAAGDGSERAHAATAETLYAFRGPGNADTGASARARGEGGDGDGEDADGDDGNSDGDDRTGWAPVSLPVDGPVADVGYGECTYAVARSGTVLVDADPATTADGAGGWRSRDLGLSDVTALAVLP